MRPESKEAAEHFIARHFPRCSVAVLAGSVVIGRETKRSDLDLVIIDDSQAAPFRAAYYEFGWPIEVFVITTDTYRYFLEISQDEGIPSLQRMLVQGVVLKDEGTAEAIIHEAREMLEEGPATWSQGELQLGRYHITECLDDLEGTSSRDEALFTVNRLVQLVPEFILRSNNRWTGVGKWAIRSLRMYNEGISEEFLTALEHFYQNGDKESLIRFADKVLEPFGGRLMAGFYQGG
jgi:predicted nucleotidyltransferase